MAKAKRTRKVSTRIIKGSGNVFADLGFDAAEAKVLEMRATLIIEIEKRVKAVGWTQVQAAKHLHITQPRVSKLLRGSYKDFSLDMLITLASRAGMEPTIELAAAA